MKIQKRLENFAVIDGYSPIQLLITLVLDQIKCMRCQSESSALKYLILSQKLLNFAKAVEVSIRFIMGKFSEKFPTMTS